MKCLLQFTISVVSLSLLTIACARKVDYSSQDVRLAQAVRDHFAASPDTKGATSGVQVEAKDGTVTLTGTADTIVDKSLAERTAQATTGVRSVINQVTVDIRPLPVPNEPFEEQKVRSAAASHGEVIGESSGDARIYQAVRRQLVNDERTPKKEIFVDVQNGNVTLRGMIFTTAAKHDAVEAALKVDGVKAVNDNLVVNTLIP